MKWIDWPSITRTEVLELVEPRLLALASRTRRCQYSTSSRTYPIGVPYSQPVPSI